MTEQALEAREAARRLVDKHGFVDNAEVSVLPVDVARTIDILAAALDRYAEARVAEAVGAERGLALTEACFIAAQVAELGERMTSPFREGVESACEEIIHRLGEAGAVVLEDSEESQSSRALLRQRAGAGPNGSAPR
jgi:hypothetical protein